MKFKIDYLHDISRTPRHNLKTQNHFSNDPISQRLMAIKTQANHVEP